MHEWQAADDGEGGDDGEGQAEADGDEETDKPEPKRRAGGEGGAWRSLWLEMSV